MRQVTQNTLPSYYSHHNRITVIEQCNYCPVNKIAFYCYGDPAQVGNRTGGEYTVAVFKVKQKEVKP